MTHRTEHKFEFKASEIAQAAAELRKYHEERLVHWQERSDKALKIVKKTIGARVVELAQTNGSYADVIVDYGDPEAWKEYKLAHRKLQTHREAADLYRSQERVYGTQGDRPYDLDPEDVHHFNIGGKVLED